MNKFFLFIIQFLKKFRLNIDNNHILHTKVINSILFYQLENVTWMQLPRLLHPRRGVHGHRLRHVMRIASHCVSMDAPSVVYTRRTRRFLRYVPRQSAVFTLTSAVVKFANDYAFFHSLFRSSKDPRNDPYLRVLSAHRVEKYRTRNAIVLPQCSNDLL